MDWIRQVVCFYRDGFRAMTVGRTLWGIILVKLAILFLVLKLFFFRDPHGRLSPEERADAVGRELIER